MREKIFVSYSHQDKDWLDRLRRGVGGVYAKFLDIWSDERIAGGENWRLEIEAAIASSRIALLFISQNFLESQFIIDDELRSILRFNETNKAPQSEAPIIWWVPLEKVDKQLLQDAGLDSIQAVGAPSPY
jgi:hypothetical protein